MTVFKICTLILFYFVTRAAFNIEGESEKEKVKINSLVAEVR